MSEAHLVNVKELPVLLFDGECAFCNACVRWLLEHERRPRYYFAPLQSSVAAALLEEHGITLSDLSSLLVIDEGKLYRKSAAALHLLRGAHWHWRIFRVFLLVPRTLRDAVYDFVGARRYRWWGRAKSCIVADPAWRSRLLVSDQSA